MHQNIGDSAKFAWIPIYRRIAEKVLEYEERQAELIDIIKEAADQGLPMWSVTDKGPDGPCEMSEIDPFTFIGAFNRGQKDKNRRQIVALVCKRLGLAPPGDIDFKGLPVVNAQSSWFFAYKADRDPEDIPSLWKLFRKAATEGLSGIDGPLFDRCLAVRVVAMAKLTMGLFWIRPDEFLAWDANNKRHLKKFGFERRLKDLDDYMAMLEFARAKFPDMTFEELSYTAYVFDRPNAWIFQANPKYYDVSRAVEVLEEMTWSVRQSYKRIVEGDRVYIWEAGQNAGIVAVATTTSDPRKDLVESEKEKEFHVDRSRLKPEKWRIKIEIDAVLKKRIPRSFLAEHEVLSELEILKFSNATNFAVTPDQDQALLELIQEMDTDADSDLCLIGSAKDFSDFEAECRQLIADHGAWACWWSFPVKAGAHEMLKIPFSLYINVGGGTFAYRCKVVDFETSTGNKGMESPWPEATFERDRDKNRIGPSQSEVFKTWFKVTKIEKLESPLSRENFRPATGLSTTANLLNQNSFGYAFLLTGGGPEVPTPTIYGTKEATQDVFLPED